MFSSINYKYERFTELVTCDELHSVIHYITVWRSYHELNNSAISVIFELIDNNLINDTIGGLGGRALNKYLWNLYLCIIRNSYKLEDENIIEFHESTIINWELEYFEREALN